MSDHSNTEFDRIYIDEDIEFDELPTNAKVEFALTFPKGRPYAALAAMEHLCYITDLKVRGVKKPLLEVTVAELLDAVVQTHLEESIRSEPASPETEEE